MVYFCDCPICGYPQYCACDSCKHDVPEGISPQIWFDSDMELIACANCHAVFTTEDWECIDIFQDYLCALEIMKLRPDITHYDEVIKMQLNEFEDYASDIEYVNTYGSSSHIYFANPNYQYLWDYLT